MSNIHRRFILLALALVVGALSLLQASPAEAHYDPAYWHSASIPAFKTDWMARLPDEAKLRSLSIPGTHDSGSINVGGALGITQTLDIPQQLASGIRALDIRVGMGQFCDDKLYIFHASVCQFLPLGQGVLIPIMDFLREHPTEFVVMRVRKENGSDDVDDLIESDLLAYGPLIYSGTSSNPTVADLRGKIFVLRQYTGTVGFRYANWERQDNYALGDQWDLAVKWGDAKAHFRTADDDPDVDTGYINFLSAAEGHFPYFFASGHSDARTDAPRLLTGWTRGVIDTCSRADRCIDEYPNVNCFLGTCSVAFEGMNIIARNYINSSVQNRTGIVYADFPGPSLIQAIINVNPRSEQIVADAGGPYDAEEGEKVRLSAAASRERDHRRLQYRWDFDGDGHWDTPFTFDPEAEFTWSDDYSGTIYVEVTNGIGAAMASASIKVNNVPPALTAEDVVTREGAAAVVDVQLDDPGVQDGFVVELRWDDGVRESFALPAGTKGFVAERTFLDDGEHTLTITARDKDGGRAMAFVQVTVENKAPEVRATGATINEGETGTVSGTIRDPGSLDTFTVTIDWGDGAMEAFSYPAGSVVFSEKHTYLDDDPSGTPLDIYQVGITVEDKDGGVGTAKAQVTVVNVPPAVAINALMDETGFPVSNGWRVTLPYVDLTIMASFTDVGVLDTHSAVIDWGDGTSFPVSPASSPLASSHSYRAPGAYAVHVVVTDDDSGVGADVRQVIVVSAKDALLAAAGHLQGLLDAPVQRSPAFNRDVQAAIAALTRADGILGDLGAAPLLDRNLRVAASARIALAVDLLTAAQATGDEDLGPVSSLLALASRSLAAKVADQAATLASRPPDRTRVAAALAALEDGNRRLRADDYARAAHAYYQSVLQAEPLLRPAGGPALRDWNLQFTPAFDHVPPRR